MAQTSNRPADTWSPLYFLASVGAGGIAVSFFMYLMFWIPHPGQSRAGVRGRDRRHGRGRRAADGRDLARARGHRGLRGDEPLSPRLEPPPQRRLRRSGAFAVSDRGAALAVSNAQTQMMAMPLALAMSVNVGFMLGLVFVPGLWGVVELLFPAALVAFVAIGALAFRQMGAFLARVIGTGGFDCKANNSFAQLLPAFALAMVGVGLAAPGAMSAAPLTAGISVMLSTFFLVASGLIALVGIILGIRSMLENGVAVEQAPTLLIVVPLMTVLGILLLRQGHGLHAALREPRQPGRRARPAHPAHVDGGAVRALRPDDPASVGLHRPLRHGVGNVARRLRADLPRRRAFGHGAFLDQQGPRRRRADRAVRPRLLGADGARGRRTGGDGRASSGPEPAAFRKPPCPPSRQPAANARALAVLRLFPVAIDKTRIATSPPGLDSAFSHLFPIKLRSAIVAIARVKTQGIFGRIRDETEWTGSRDRTDGYASRGRGQGDLRTAMRAADCRGRDGSLPGFRLIHEDYQPPPAAAPVRRRSLRFGHEGSQSRLRRAVTVQPRRGRCPGPSISELS